MVCRRKRDWEEDAVSRSVTEQQQRNRAEQERLYGAPLGDLLAEVAQTLDVTQARLARLLGLSAPMLSQLASGHRVKIGNPGAVARLHRLITLSGDVRDGRATAAEVIAAVEEDPSDRHLLTSSSQVLAGRAGVEVVRRLLRSALPSDVVVQQTVRELEGEHPGLAEILRVYALGSDEEARTHLDRILGGSSG
jgi:transcriptional regulator with XRE-family HTH domain